MTSPGPFRDSRSGMIMVDVLLGLVFAAILVSGLTTASLEARQIYDRAHDRADIIRIFEEHENDFGGLLPYESRTMTYALGSTSDVVTGVARADWYGNDRIETVIRMTYNGRSVTFRVVRNYPFVDIGDVAGTPLCSVEMSTDQLADADIVITPIALPIDPSLPLTDLEIRNGIAYISADSTTASDPDLLSVDVRDPMHVNMLSSINTGAGLVAINIARQYVFAAAASTAAQLHIVRLDGLGSMSIAKKYKLPLPEASTTPPVGSAVFYDRGMVYLGTSKWDGEELSLIDVSDPVEPVKVGWLETGSKVNDIFARDGIAYVAGSDMDQLRFVDVRDRNHPLLVSSFSPSGSERQQGRVLSYFEDGLYLGRTPGGFNVRSDHEAFSFPNASSAPGVYEPMRPPSIALPPLSLDIPGGVYGMVVDRHHVFLATRDIDRELTVLDHSLSTTTALYRSLPVAPQAIACDQDRLYILAKTAPVIYEIHFEN